MNLVMAKAAVAALDEIGTEDDYGKIEVLPEYSGRGMYGRSTAALTGRRSDIYLAFGILLSRGEVEKADIDVLGEDSLGMDVVVY